jgi:hypothetical protein
VPGKTRCEKCLARASAAAAERYELRKSLSVCPQCKKDSAEPDSVYCKACLMYHKEKMDVRRQDDDYKEQQKERAAEWYKAKKAERMCPQCNERLAAPGRVNCSECRKYHADGASRRNVERRNIVFGHYGTVCKCCGQQKPTEKLQIDHVASNGAAHRREIGKSRLYAWLIKNNFPAGFIVLCSDCNFAWGHNRCCPDAAGRLVPITVDGEVMMKDAQTGKIVRQARSTCE